METEDTSGRSVRISVVAHWPDNRVEIDVPGMSTASLLMRDLFIPVRSDRRVMAAKDLPVQPPMFAEIVQTTTERMAYASPVDDEPPAAA